MSAVLFPGICADIFWRENIFYSFAIDRLRDRRAGTRACYSAELWLALHKRKRRFLCTKNRCKAGVNVIILKIFLTKKLEKEKSGDFDSFNSCLGRKITIRK
jgi:hypothetical protein